MTVTRDRQRELDWLRQAVVVDRTGVIPVALARIDRTGQAHYGDTWATRPVGELVGEMREECADIPGWGVLAHQRLAAAAIAGDVDQAAAAAADAHLAAAVELAARADTELAAALRALGAL